MYNCQLVRCITFADNGMRQVINGALGLLLILIASCAAAPQSKVEDMPKLLPKNCVSAEHYRCKDMVDCVNSFRRIGKDESLSLMTEYIQARRKAGDDYKEELKLLFVCRLLFVNTDGWKPLMLGHPVPEVNPDVANEFPLFPIALSDGLPFNLVNGYAGIGVPSETGYG